MKTIIKLIYLKFLPDLFLGVENFIRSANLVTLDANFVTRLRAFGGYKRLNCFRLITTITILI
jgi:hypothetical protein